MGAPCAASTGLTNGNAYSIIVRARNARGWSDTWATAPNVTPASNAVPYPPEYVSASAGNASAMVSWEAPATNGGPPIDGYVVQLLKNNLWQNQTGLLPPASGPHNTYKWTTGLTNGQVYKFRVYPHNATNYGTYADTNEVTPTATPPPFPPRNPRVDPGDSTVLVQWTAPDTSGPAPDYYQVNAYSDAGFVTYQVTAGPLPTASLFTGLTNGTRYIFLIYAHGPNGFSNYTVTPWATPASNLGDLLRPTNVQAVRGDKQATVTWTKPTLAVDGTTSYAVQAYRAADNAAAGTVATTTGTSAIVTGLKNGTPVYFKVTATNLILLGFESAPSNTVTPAGPPFAPVNIAAAEGDTTATITWDAPPARADGTPGDNGDPITSYTVTATPGGVQQTANSGLARSLTFTGLKNGTSYTFTVRAKNGVAAGEVSTSSNAVTPAGRPFPPTNVAATAHKGYATVSWSPPPVRADGTPGNNGRAISSYIVTASPGGAFATTENGSTTQLSIGGLTNGVSYTFTVRAVNAKGTSDPSVPSNAATPFGSPSAPTNVTAVPGPDSQSATVSWTASNPNGAAPVTYTVTGTPGADSAQTTATSAVVDGLVAGTEYTFRVVATNSAGSSPPSAPSNATSPECTEEGAAGARTASASAFPGDECNPSLIFQCNNGEDDDGDGLVDWPDDTECSNSDDNSESDAPPPTAACDNDSDDDGDGLVDYPADPGCADLADDDETDVTTLWGIDTANEVTSAYLDSVREV